MEKPKCLICGKKLKWNTFFLCQEHFDKIGNYQEEGYNQALKNFLESWNEIKKYETFKKTKNDILIAMNFEEEKIENIINELLEYKQGFNDFNKKITNEKNPGLYKVKNKPLIVRSNCELTIANALINNQIKFIYEKQISKEHNYLSDFYLLDYNIYIEYWGRSDKNYSKNKANKIKLYKELNLDLISLEKYDVATKTEKEITKKILKEINIIQKKKVNI